MTNLLLTALITVTNNIPTNTFEDISLWIAASKEIGSRRSENINPVYFQKLAIENLSQATTLLLKEVIELKQRVAKLENKE